jgi:hypothetical protein
MNRNHWSAYTEAELAQMKAGGSLRASRTRPGPARVRLQQVDVTAETRAFLKNMPRSDEPAYPPAWLPELQGTRAVRATQTPAEWMSEQEPPHRNGTQPAGSPASDAYPAYWLNASDLHPGSSALGGEGFLTDRKRDAA